MCDCFTSALRFLCLLCSSNTAVKHCLSDFGTWTYNLECQILNSHVVLRRLTRHWGEAGNHTGVEKGGGGGGGGGQESEGRHKNKTGSSGIDTKGNLTWMAGLDVSKTKIQTFFFPLPVQKAPCLGEKNSPTSVFCRQSLIICYSPAV